MVMSSASRIFPEKIGLSSHYGSHSCNCCPYGYHIDLDFVRYCEELANANPSENEMQRRHNRRSRKSMEFMLGLENLSLGEWDQIRESGEGNLPSSSPLATFDISPTSNKVSVKCPETRPRSASVPRFSFNTSSVRPDSPFGTASSTCSSKLGAESDVPFSLYQQHRRQRKHQQHPADTHAFLRDALDDVCSDFERTLERASVRRKKNTVQLFEGGFKTNAAGFDDNNNCSSYNRLANVTCHEKRTFSKWERQFDSLDSCVAGNKSPRSSRILSRSSTLPYIVQQKPTDAEQKYELYVKANVAANATTPVDGQVQYLMASTPSTSASVSASSPPPPPPPPRRHTLNRLRSPEVEFPKPLQNVENEKILQNVSIKETPSTADTQSLYNMRQQMALSVSRMRDLEEQVKTIPELKLELQQLREEKRRLELNRTTIREATTRISESPSPKIASPVQFTPQHINSISLESLGARIRTSSISSNSDRTNKYRTVMKRDVGTNCNRAAKRDVAVGSPVLSTRSVSTEPEQNLHISDQLYTQGQMEECVKKALKRHKEQRLLNTTTRATQMIALSNNLRHTGSQTNSMPARQDNAVMCKPNIRSVASSDHRITDILCGKCSVKKCNIACGTNDDEDSKKYWVSLKTLDTPYTRSNTFSLGEQERINLLVRKSVGTQYIPQVSVNAFSQTTSMRLQTVGVQNTVSQRNSHTQTFNEQLHQETDTKDLIKLCIRETNCEEIAADPVWKENVSKKAVSKHSKACNTEIVHTRDSGENTIIDVTNICHTGINTEQVSKRDVGCGDIVKPHISIACAENYCDSCKDAIKNLAKDFCKGQPLMSPVPTRANDSRIPRPKHLSSPSPVRKQIYRQNTYTITSSPTPSPVAEKKLMSSSLSSSFLKQRSATEIKNTEMNKRFGRKAPISKSSETMETKSRPIDEKQNTDTDNLNEPLIVREEKRVSICWSREASPLPPQTDNYEPNSLQLSTSEKASQSMVIHDNKSSPRQTSKARVTKQDQEQEKEGKFKSNEIYTPTSEIQLALKMVNESLLKKMGAKSLASNSLQPAKSTIQQEWFHISSTEQANPADVQAFFNFMEKLSLQLLEHCVNLRDNNGNTALHYAVSHGNFDIVSILLDSKVCDVNQMNNAGYTCVMLVSLAKLKDTRHRAVVERLFSMADINIRAKKHCQTALMLAVSHGNLDMVQMLLEAGADINVQDEDGSTALMCAAEHGRIDIVKHLLSHSDCDSLIQDVDCSTAFKIAWQGGYRDIGLLLYVHEQMLRSKMPHRSEQQPKTPTPLPHADKQNSTSK